MAACCVLSCGNDASQGAPVINGLVNGEPVKVFLKPDHSGRMCKDHQTANHDLVQVRGRASPSSTRFRH
jgi:hypothetical protein